MFEQSPAAAPAPAPALIGDSAALFADVRRKYQAELPFSNKTEAANWFRLSEVLDHAEALTARAEKAEARVKEIQVELSEQEVDKLRLVRELRQGRAALHNATR